MRTRTTNTAFTQPTGIRTVYIMDKPSMNVFTNQTVNSPVHSGTALCNGVETITDELPQMKRYGYCKHTKVKTELSSPEFAQEWITNGAPGNLRYYTVTFSGGYWAYLYFRGTQWTKVDTVDIAVKAIDWPQLSYQALEKMRPSFNDGLSLANDLLELRQIKELLTPIGKRGSIPLIGNKLTQRLSNLHLWWQFGIKPLARSARQIADLIARMPEKLRQLREQSGKVQTRHYSRPMDILATLPSDTTWVISNDITVGPGAPISSDLIGLRLERYVRITRPAKYHASMRFVYDVSSLTDLELRIKAWSEALGFTNLLSIAWNAIPFSFIVDWFVSVDEWISSLASEPVIPIVVQDFCHSVEYEHRISLSARIQLVSNANPIPFVYRTTRFYERRRDTPSLTSTLEFDLPSISNVFIGAALIGSRSELKRQAVPKPRLKRR